MNDVDYAHTTPVVSMTDDQVAVAFDELPYAVRVYGEQTIADVKRSIVMGYRLGRIAGDG